jgi:hypothetical protein
MEDVQEVETPHVPDTRHYTGNTSVLSPVNTHPRAPVPPNGEHKAFNLTRGSSFLKQNSKRVSDGRALLGGTCIQRPGPGLKYLHRSPASRNRRRKGNPVPGGITGLPWSWMI